MEILVGCLGLCALLLLLAVGIHIGVALSVVSICGLMFFIGLKPTVTLLATSAFHFATDANFIVIPIFTLMGLVAMYGGVSEAAFNALRVITDKLPGGLAIAAVVGCSAFGTVCGSSSTTALVFAKAACPQMRRLGYDKRLAYGVVSASGMIGMLIPPSILTVVWALITEESLGSLLIAGIGPGLLLALIYAVGIIVMVRFKPALAPSVDVKFTWKQRLIAFKGLWPIIIVAVVMIGGIFGGVATPTEAAAWGALVVVVISFLWGGMTWKQLWDTLCECVSIMGMVFLLLIGSNLFSAFIAFTGIAKVMLDIVINMNPTTWQLLLGMVILYLVLGTAIDTFPLIMLTIPIIYPIVKTMGIEPMWFAMVCIMSIEIALITPPSALNVFVAQSVAEPDVTLEDIYRGVVPFTLMALLANILLIIFPAIANWLPQQIMN